MYRTAQLVITDPVNTFFPEIREAMQLILEGLGTEVKFPTDQTCCSQLFFNSGLQSGSRSWAEHIIRIFKANSRNIITSSGKFAFMIRIGLPDLFAEDPSWLERAQALAHRTYEFSEYVVDHLGVNGGNAT